MRASMVLVLAAALAATGSAKAADFVYPQGGTITTQWGTKRSYEIHKALDIAGPNGSSNIAARPGKVRFAGYAGGYGYFVQLAHASGYETAYGHHSRLYVRTGQHVNLGQALGAEGSTGHSTGPHLHFEIRRYGAKIYIPGRYHAHLTKGAAIPQSYPGLRDVTKGGGGGGSVGRPTLRYGDRGAAVSSAQRLLRARGAGISVDGIFGPKTLAAVKAFQRRRHLTVDGIVGPKTWSALRKK